MVDCVKSFAQAKKYSTSGVFFILILQYCILCIIYCMGSGDAFLKSILTWWQQIFTDEVVV